MRFFLPVFIFSLFISSELYAQECTSNWDYYLDTNPLHKKVVTGDSNAGYAVFSFWGNPDLRLELRGNFPKVRFMSLESQSTKLSISEDNLFDYKIEPDKGSLNPSRVGVSLDTPNRAFTVSAVQGKDPNSVNTLNLPDGRLGQSIMLRAYSPHKGITLTVKDLPRVFAFDRRTGKPVSCPKPAGYPVRWHFPQILADIVGTIKPLEFQDPGETNLAGLNKAASYLYALSKLNSEEVILIRFKSPSFFNTQSGTGTFQIKDEVRYWSFCTQNFPNNETLNCVPDFLAKVKEDGNVTIVVGGGKLAEKKASELGFTYLPDARESKQHTMGFVYRNLIPTDEFKKNHLYQGEYLPVAVKFSLEEFLSFDQDLK